MKRTNRHTGSSFEDFLKEEGIAEEVTAKALKRALSEQLRDAMEAQAMTKVAMAAHMATSRSQLDRLLDPDNLKIQFDSLIRAAAAVGKTVEIKLIDIGAAV
jgi:predicted XRE-type DNA-binding protein